MWQMGSIAVAIVASEQGREDNRRLGTQTGGESIYRRPIELRRIRHSVIIRRSRRAANPALRFLQQGSLVLGGLAAGSLPRGVLGGCSGGSQAGAADRDLSPIAITPIVNRSGTRFYRESLTKFPEAIDKFNSLGLDMVVELGDLIDETPDAAGEIAHFKKMEEVYARFKGDRHYVLGNHCVWTLTKEEFLDNCGMEKAALLVRQGRFPFRRARRLLQTGRHAVWAEELSL